MHACPHELADAMQLAATSHPASTPPSLDADPSRNLSKSCVHPHKTATAATGTQARTMESYLKSPKGRLS